VALPPGLGWAKKNQRRLGPQDTEPVFLTLRGKPQPKFRWKLERLSAEHTKDDPKGSLSSRSCSLLSPLDYKVTFMEGEAPWCLASPGYSPSPANDTHS
jgi:hypothetical protein